MTQALAVRQVNIGGYNLSVTTRDCGDPRDVMEELTYRTIVGWLFIATLLEQGVISVEGVSVEQKYGAEHEIEFKESFSGPRVTVWDTYRGQKQISFHLSSDDIPQLAVDMWLANLRAINRAMEKFPDAPSVAPGTPTNGAVVPISNITAIDGVIAATRAPTPSTPQYADGQLVSYQINRIAAGSNKGSATFALWGAIGQKYPLVTIYKHKPNSQEQSSNYIAAEPVLKTLGLSLDKPEAAGSWVLVCRAAHSNGKEYMNPVSLTEA